MLCEKCLTDLDECMKRSEINNFIHCHHDEVKEEKIKCWCEQPTINKRLQLHDYVIDKWGLGHYQMRSPENAIFCPRCGRRLIE